MTRKEYLNVDKETQPNAHRVYYSQFVTDSIKAGIIRIFGIEKLRQAMAQDGSFNTIPLKKWDALGSLLDYQGIAPKMKELGDYLTMAGTVCILKEAAKQAVEEVA